MYNFFPKLIILDAAKVLDWNYCPGVNNLVSLFLELAPIVQKVYSMISLTWLYGIHGIPNIDKGLTFQTQFALHEV